MTGAHGPPLFWRWWRILGAVLLGLVAAGLVVGVVLAVAPALEAP